MFNDVWLVRLQGSFTPEEEEKKKEEKKPLAALKTTSENHLTIHYLHTCVFAAAASLKTSRFGISRPVASAVSHAQKVCLAMRRDCNRYESKYWALEVIRKSNLGCDYILECRLIGYASLLAGWLAGWMAGNRYHYLGRYSSLSTWLKIMQQPTHVSL